MSVEAIMKAISELNPDDRDRVFDFMEGMYEVPALDQKEADRLDDIVKNTKRWYSEEEVEHLFNVKDED